MIKNTFAVFGAFVMGLWFLGAIGAGNFVLKFDTNPIICIRGV